jgi:S1-C subfamily serine protease
MLSEIDADKRAARPPLDCFGTLIQTDTRLNLGCSGGALLNLQGELVGLTSSVAGLAGGETPGGFAVPLSAGMRRIIEVLRRGEEVEYGFLGVTLRPDNTVEGHVVIDGVLPGGPAQHGRLRGRGELILSVNGTPVHNNDELFLAIGLHLAGSVVRVETADSPQGAKRIQPVTLAKFPLTIEPVIASKRPKPRGGLRVDWSSVLSPSLRSVPEGVVIREVQPGSAAEKARLQPNKIIKRVNDQKVKTPDDFYREMDKAKGPVELLYASAEGNDEQRVTIDSK